jgi:DNA-binding winged helix-turn-helix (wHTH) protein
LEGRVSVRFGDCVFDTEARQLRRAGDEVHLSPKGFELLKLLVEARPRALSKRELLDRIWPGVFVSDASLARVVNEVRDGIGDHAKDPRFLRTVHGFGYAFEAEAIGDAIDASARSCWFVCGDRIIELREGEQTIGRDPNVEIVLDSARVSRRHSRIVVHGARAVVTDLGSKNGTFIRDRRLDAPADLQPGDTVRIGPFQLVFAVAGDPDSTETDVISLEPV